MLHYLPKSLPDFSQANILVAGDVMLDRYWFGDALRISPEAPVPIVNINSIDNRPGGAGNVALNISALGAHASLLGITGDDEAARMLEKQLTAVNVSHDLCKIAGLATIIKLRVISRHQQLLRLDFEEKFKNTDKTAFLECFKQQLHHKKLVILSDYNKGTLSDPQILIRLAKEAHIPVLVDPKGSDFSIYRHATILTPNYKEFETIVGPCSTEQDIVDKGKALMAKLNIQALLITRGEDGMTLINTESSACDGEFSVTHFPAYAREVFDVTGAGDTVIAALGSAYAAGLDLASAAALANLAASLAVGKLGAAAITPPELLVALTGKTSFVSGIVNEEQLLRAVKETRAQGKKIVFTNGCYDLIHAGHVTTLQMAKQLGDYLIVAVNTDDSIRKLKGESRPINHLEHRMTVLAGLGVVDWVVPFADDTPERLLSVIKPDLLVKGSDYNLDQVVGADIVRAYGGEVRIMNHNVNTSSTAIINRIQHIQTAKVD